MISWLLDQVCRLILISLTSATSDRTYPFHSVRQSPRTRLLQVKPPHPFRATSHQLFILLKRKKTYIALGHRNESLRSIHMPLHQSHIKYPTPLQSNFLGSPVNSNTSISPLRISGRNIRKPTIFLNIGSRVPLNDHSFLPSCRIRVSLNNLTIGSEVFGSNSLGMDWDSGRLE